MFLDEKNVHTNVIITHTSNIHAIHMRVIVVDQPGVSGVILLQHPSVVSVAVAVLLCLEHWQWRRQGQQAVCCPLPQRVKYFCGKQLRL